MNREGKGDRERSEQRGKVGQREGKEDREREKGEQRGKGGQREIER